jgi:hypothetical protein
MSINIISAVDSIGTCRYIYFKPQNCDFDCNYFASQLELLTIDGMGNFLQGAHTLLLTPKAQKQDGA